MRRNKACWTLGGLLLANFFCPRQITHVTIPNFTLFVHTYCNTVATACINLTVGPWWTTTRYLQRGFWMGHNGFSIPDCNRSLDDRHQLLMTADIQYIVRHQPASFIHYQPWFATTYHLWPKPQALLLDHWRFLRLIISKHHSSSFFRIWTASWSALFIFKL